MSAAASLSAALPDRKPPSGGANSRLTASCAVGANLSGLFSERWISVAGSRKRFFSSARARSTSIIASTRDGEHVGQLLRLRLGIGIGVGIGGGWR